MPLVSSGKPSAIGATSVAVLVAYSEYYPVVGRRQIGWCLDPMPPGFGVWERGRCCCCDSWSFETPFLLVDHVLESKGKRETGPGKERDRRKVKKEGRMKLSTVL